MKENIASARLGVPWSIGQSTVLLGFQGHS
jgi:hypothetical protein